MLHIRWANIKPINEDQRKVTAAVFEVFWLQDNHRYFTNVSMKLEWSFIVSITETTVTFQVTVKFWTYLLHFLFSFVFFDYFENISKKPPIFLPFFAIFDIFYIFDIFDIFAV